MRLHLTSCSLTSGIAVSLIVCSLHPKAVHHHKHLPKPVWCWILQLCIYDDEDKQRREEIEALGGDDRVYGRFYDRLKEVRDYHRRFPSTDFTEVRLSQINQSERQIQPIADPSTLFLPTMILASGFCNPETNSSSLPNLTQIRTPHMSPKVSYHYPGSLTSFY